MKPSMIFGADLQALSIQLSIREVLHSEKSSWRFGMCCPLCVDYKSDGKMDNKRCWKRVPGGVGFHLVEFDCSSICKNEPPINIHRPRSAYWRISISPLMILHTWEESNTDHFYLGKMILFFLSFLIMKNWPNRAFSSRSISTRDMR